SSLSSVKAFGCQGCFRYGQCCSVPEWAMGSILLDPRRDCRNNGGTLSFAECRLPATALLGNDPGCKALRGAHVMSDPQKSEIVFHDQAPVTELCTQFRTSCEDAVGKGELLPAIEPYLARVSDGLRVTLRRRLEAIQESYRPTDIATGAGS